MQKTIPCPREDYFCDTESRWHITNQYFPFASDGMRLFIHLYADILFLWDNSGRATDSQSNKPNFKCHSAVLSPGRVHSPHSAPVKLSCMNEYLAIDSGRCLCTSSIYALIET